MNELKLVALDAEDLAVISAHLQDACVCVSEMAYLPREKRFAAILSRFDWTSAVQEPRGSAGAFRRCRTALRFERVLEAKQQGIDLQDRRRVLCLLAVRFEETDPPGGDVTLIFAGEAAIRLRVECIEAEMRDLGAAWQARHMPEHPGEPLPDRSA